MTELRFEGVLPAWAAVALAIGLALLAGLLYRRELRQGVLGWLLPVLRGLAVLLIVLMLAGPQWVTTTGEDHRGRVIVLVDASRSMTVTDEQMPVDQKQRIAAQLALGGSSASGQVAAFDHLSRWTRAQRLLLDLDRGQLPGLVDEHDLELVLLDGDRGRSVWSTRSSGPIPTQFGAQPQAAVTDLSSVLLRRLDTAGADDRLAFVIVTDGRQNLGSPLIKAAQRAKAMGAAVHSLAVGTRQSPNDLSIADIEHPPSLFPDDRVSGSITVLDAMPPGLPFTVQIVADERVLWQSRQVTIGGPQQREIQFDFPIRSAVDRATAKLTDTSDSLTVNQLPVAMQVRVVGLEGDREAANNQMDFHVRVAMGVRKMLILTGRPRWEMRYLNTMFSRDPRWEVTTLYDPTGKPRTDTPDPGVSAFPATRDQLMSYDIIVLGELRPGSLSDGELGWLYDFVADRAGGLVVIDGRRGHLAAYAQSPIGPLLPSRRNERGRRPRSMELTLAGQQAQALRLESDETDNAQIWAELLAPSYIAPIDVVPGADTVLMEMPVGAHGEERWPAVFTRRVGAGWVWYSAFDETWRWRREYESLYQERYWHQVTNRVVEPLYAAEDRYVSLGVDQTVIDAGKTVPIRVRIRDDQGHARTQADAVAYLSTLAGQRVAQVALTPDSVEGGRFTGEIGADLPPGVYRVKVSVQGLSESDMLASSLVTIRGRESAAGELADVTLNLDLLQAVAATTGGQVLREDQADRLPAILDGLSYSTRQETVSKPWQSWPWFISIVSLLAVELTLRRVIGLI